MHGPAARFPVPSTPFLASAPFFLLAPGVPWIRADGAGDVDVIDARVGPAGVMKTATRPSSIAMKMPRHHLGRLPRNRSLVLIPSSQPTDIYSLRLTFPTRSAMPFSYCQVISV